MEEIERRLVELRAWADGRFRELRERQRRLLESALKAKDKGVADRLRAAIAKDDDRAEGT